MRNDSEVRVIVSTIAALLQRGIPSSSLAVITLYKPHGAALKRRSPTSCTQTHARQRTTRRASALVTRRAGCRRRAPLRGSVASAPQWMVLVLAVRDDVRVFERRVCK